ncbi:LemA family protein [Glacieibacterium frigidum]|uniref:LemA family protein n=1 Tax=Glacieibacterium frigidum TaxID=2593303 RepID=A0A552UAB8_9SPHN|nr:LemA family protein [Glacieibacterium frigidum]TRW15166.1 LemA family protein [Glacieibacterium frigidum]
MGVIGWIVVAVIIGGLYLWYATIVTRRNRVGEALAGVDVQLQQRHDLIPNLLTIAKRFMEHERGLLDEITALRARAASATDPAAKFAAEGQLDIGLGKLFAVAEAYPDLKSDGPMIEAQRGLSEVETNISAARRFYNSAVGDLRNATQIFPGTLLAGLAGASTPPPFYEAPDASRAAVDASKYL